MKATKTDLISSILLLEKALETLSAETKEQEALIKALSTENESLKIKNLELEAISRKEIEDYFIAIINSMTVNLDK